MTITNETCDIVHSLGVTDIGIEIRVSSKQALQYARTDLGLVNVEGALDVERDDFFDGGCMDVRIDPDLDLHVDVVDIVLVQLEEAYDEVVPQLLGLLAVQDLRVEQVELPDLVPQALVEVPVQEQQPLGLVLQGKVPTWCSNKCTYSRHSRKQ